jgi:hypothetical protein
MGGFLVEDSEENRIMQNSETRNQNAEVPARGPDEIEKVEGTEMRLFVHPFRREMTAYSSQLTAFRFPNDNWRVTIGGRLPAGLGGVPNPRGHYGESCRDVKSADMTADSSQLAACGCARSAPRQ